MRNLKEIEGAGKKTRKTRAGRARPTLYTQALTPDRPPQPEITGSTELLVGAAYFGSHAMILRPGLAYGCRAVYVLGSAGPWVPPSRLPPGRLLDCCSAACLPLRCAAGPLADSRLALVICPGFLVALPFVWFLRLGPGAPPRVTWAKKKKK